MKGLICVLLTIFCISGAQGKSCPVSTSTLFATDSWQELTSPNYGIYNYADNTLCEWTIRSQDRNKRIALVVDNLDLETRGSTGCYDYIEISDDYSFNRQYCRPGMLPITSGGQTLYVKFSTDSSNTKTGFRLRYRLTSSTDVAGTMIPIQTCRSGGVDLQAETDAKYITSLNYPLDYPHDTDCVWTIQSQTVNYVVKIVVEDMELEYSSSCSYDYLIAYDGSATYSTQLQKWCGTNKPTLYSSGTSLTLKFHSDGSSSGRGFKLSYQEVPESERVTGLSTGAIVGIVFGVLGGLIFLSICCCCCCCDKKNKPAVPAGTRAVAAPAVGGAGSSNHVSMTTPGNQVFFTTSTFSPNSGQMSTNQMSTNQYSAAYAPPVYPGPAQVTSPAASAPPMGFSYPQPYATPAGYPPQIPTSTTGNPYYSKQQSIPSEPPPPYWMASQYELQPGQQPSVDASAGQSQPSGSAEVPVPGADGSAPAPGAPRGGQSAPGGSDNRAFVADDV